MRIGINASFLRKPGTGIGQVSTHFLKEMVKFQNSNSKYQKWEFLLYCEENPQPSFSLPENFVVKGFLPLWKRDDLLRKWLWEKQVADEVQRDGCNVFLSLYQSSTIFHQLSSIRHVMVVHDIIPRIFPEYQGNIRQKYYWKAVERGIRKADSIVAVSEATKNDLVEFGIAHDTISVGYPDTAPIFRQDLALEEENRVMATYSLVPGYIYHGGGLELRKNTGGLLRAYKQLIVSNQQKIGGNETALEIPPLVISGKIFSENNPLAAPVKKLVQELGLGERVRLLDFVPEQDLPALYKNALFFVYPSLYEGFGLPVLEAIRMGAPVLTSDNSSLLEVAGDAALYIDPHTVESIASGMERLIKDADLRKTLRDATRHRSEHFSWKRFVETVLDSLESAVPRV